MVQTEEEGAVCEDWPLSPSHLVPPCCTIPASTIHVVLWVVFSESYHFRSYLYSNSQNPGSWECDPDVLPYTSLYLWWWTMDSYIPISKGDCINIWTIISERSETNARGDIWLRPTKDHSLLNNFPIPFHQEKIMQWTLKLYFLLNMQSSKESSMYNG